MTTPTPTSGRPSPRELAHALGVTTADLIRPPVRAAEDHARERDRWSREKKMAFDSFEPSALCLVASDGPVSVTLWGPGGEVQRLGHNRGIWPARIVKTGSWKDTATATWDKNPFFHLGTQFRLWCPTVKERDTLAEKALGLMEERAAEFGGPFEPRHGFLDLGPELDLEFFKLELGGIAERLSIPCWDDEGLSLFLDRLVRTAEAIVRERGGEINPRLLERVSVKAIGRA